MALPLFAKQSIVLVLPSMIEERGNLVEDWSSPSRETVEGCSVQPGAGARDTEHEDAVTADYTVYLPPDAVVDRRARVELPTTDGQFILQGEPQPWIFGMSTDHVRIRLRRRNG